MTHTPLPWRLEVSELNEEDVFYVECEKGVMPDYPSCTSVIDAELGITRQDDAEFIVRACNAHHDLVTAAKNAAAVIGAVYEWLDRVEKAGGATSITGIASCNAMLKSLKSNTQRTEILVMEPLRQALAKAQ